MKVLLMGDFSNYHRALADGLRRLGHSVTVASAGTQWMQTERDLDLSRRSGKLGGALLYARLRSTLRPQLRGFDVVQVCSPLFVDLKPHRVSKIFNQLRHDNGRVFLTALSTDSHYVARCSSTDAPLRYSEWQVDGRPSEFALSPYNMRSGWLTEAMVRHDKHIYEGVDGAVTALYEYHRVLEDAIPASRLSYAGIPINTETIRPVELPPIGNGHPLRIMVAYPRARMVEKGADRLLEIARTLEQRYPGRIVVDEVTQLPYKQFVERIKQNHIVVDQLYSYTPGTTALLAMAMGRVTLSGGEEDFYNFIGETELRPIINTDPSDLQLTLSRLEEVALNPTLLCRMAAEGPEFVRRHNDTTVVARRFEQAWQR